MVTIRFLKINLQLYPASSAYARKPKVIVARENSMSWQSKHSRNIFWLHNYLTKLNTRKDCEDTLERQPRKLAIAMADKIQYFQIESDAQNKEPSSAYCRESLRDENSQHLRGLVPKPSGLNPSPHRGLAQDLYTAEDTFWPVLRAYTALQWCMA